MRLRTVSCILALGFALGIAATALAVVVPGGGNKKTDCYAGFEVGAEEGAVTQPTPTSILVNGTTSGTLCTFDVQLCVNEPVPGCTAAPGGVTGFPVNTGNLATPAGSARCGAVTQITLPLKGKKHNKPAVKKIRVVADTAAAGRLKKDPDALKLRCSLSTGPTSCPTGCPVPAGACPANAVGGPNYALVSTASTGTDLDNGWTGTSHNFPVVPCSNLKVCLSGCDTTSNPVCTIQGPTGTGSINTDVFGPPLPLLAANVPVCVTNRFMPGEVIPGTANLQTGETNITIDLLSDVFFTTAGEVCPRCKNGACTSGTNTGKPCTVEGTVTVAQAAGDQSYPVTRDCPPSKGESQFAGTLPIHLPLTTGTATLQGSRPCTGPPNEGVPVQDDQCAGGSCNATCSGLACVKKAADGITCIDSKGGLSQVCCSTDTTKPCFPTAQKPGVDGKITRTGIPKPVTPAWNDPTFPKTSDGTVVSVFCEPATSINSINTTAGLPGPGALILPGTVCVNKE